MTLTFNSLHIERNNFNLKAHFTITQGEKIALIGASGAGKSTLLASLAGFYNLTAGAIFYNQTNITNLTPAQRPVSLLFQDHNLFPHLYVWQNIALGLRPNLRLSIANHTTVQNALNRVGLNGYGDKKPNHLSGGQQQRVALARALLRDKPILCLDEPFAALGPALRYDMLDLVNEIVKSNNITLLMVTHLPEDTLYIADKAVLIADGNAQDPVNTRQLFDNPPKELITYLGKQLIKNN